MAGLRLRLGAVGVALAAACAAPVALPGQQGVVIDRVVAVVGNKPVLQSQVDEQLFLLLSQPTPPELRTPADTQKVRRQIVSDMIDEELMVQEAQRDTAVKVTDEEVTEAVEARLKDVRRRFTSDEEYREELRRTGFLSPDEYRRWLNDNQRRELLRNRLTERLRGKGQLKPVQPTEREMRDFYAESRDQLGKRPATISFRQLVVAPKPDSAARARAFALADSIAAELRKGGDFAVAARRFSGDPGSKEQGGSLGWQRRGTFVPEFERVAFAIKPGAISYPVETTFGFHVIQVERVQPGEVLARHILITPEVTAAGEAEARALAERAREALARGASFDSLQRLHHDQGEESIGEDVPADRLPPVYARALEPLDDGGVSGVLPLEQGDRRKFAVLVLTERRPEGEVRFEDVKDAIRRRLSEQFGIRRYLDGLRKRTYVEIRDA